MTSPVAVTGLDDGDEYEAQWRANSGGVVDTIAITAGGTGYTFIPTVTITGGGGSGATATAVISGRGGSVTEIIIDDGGSGYTSAPTVTISSGGGSGATATATFFAAQNGSWSDSGTARTDLADLMPTVGAIDDITVEQGEDLDETLPEATGGDLPITYSMTRLASMDELRRGYPPSDRYSAQRGQFHNRCLHCNRHGWRYGKQGIHYQCSSCPCQLRYGWA